MKKTPAVLSACKNIVKSGTAEFCRMNDFSDCTNVRSLTKHKKKRNPLIKPYTSQADERFSWLKDVFLNYLETWKQSTVTREGNHSVDDRGKMFLSLQTYNGLFIRILKPFSFYYLRGFSMY